MRARIQPVPVSPAPATEKARARDAPRLPGAAEPPAAAAAVPNRSRGALRWLAVVSVALVVAAGVAYRRARLGRALPAGLVQVNGRIEGDASMVASKQPGRLRALLVREGDAVTQGQVLAQLDDAVLRARLAQAEAASDVTKARAEAARAALSVMRREVPLRIASARAAQRSAHARAAEAGAGEAQARREQARVRDLYAARSLDQKSMERADLALDTASSGLEAARAADSSAEQALADAKLGPSRVRAAEADLQALEAGARQALAAVEEARSALADLTITSPVAGTVTTRFAEGGAVVSPGTPLFEIVDLDQLYLKVFVPETEVGKVRIGLPARIYTDAFPNRAFPAVLRYLASRAEFTPKEVQTRDERVKLVYAAKLYVSDNRARHLTPGLSADAVIRWDEAAPWTPPRL